MRGSRVTVAALLLALFVAMPIHSAPAAVSATVEVRNTEFRPSSVRIRSGDSVRWDVVDGGHTITSDDGLFDFPETKPTVAAGESYEFAFANPGTFTFRCKLHGSMTGTVYVDVDPAVVEPQVRLVPSKQYPTVHSALLGIPAGSTVAVKPGTYKLSEAIELSTDGLTLRPSEPGTVTFEYDGPADARTSGVVVGRETSSVGVERVTLRGFPWAGVVVDAARNARLTDVVVFAAGGESGLRILHSTFGALERPVVHDALGGGIDVIGCKQLTCPSITDGRLLGNAVGISVAGRGVVSVVRATIDASRTGISLAGVEGALVRHNTVTAATAVSITGPSEDVKVIDNSLSGDVGISWDALGTACFSGNRTPAGAPASTSPPGLQTLFPCG